MSHQHTSQKFRSCQAECKQGRVGRWVCSDTYEYGEYSEYSETNDYVKIVWSLPRAPHGANYEYGDSPNKPKDGGKVNVERCEDVMWAVLSSFIFIAFGTPPHFPINSLVT